MVQCPSPGEAAREIRYDTVRGKHDGYRHLLTPVRRRVAVSAG